MNTPLGRGAVARRLTKVILLQSFSVYRSNLARYVGILHLMYSYAAGLSRGKTFLFSCLRLS